MDISDGESFGFVNTASALGVGEGVRLCGLLVLVLVLVVMVMVFYLCICVCSDVGISPFFLLSSVLFHRMLRERRGDWLVRRQRQR